MSLTPSNPSPSPPSRRGRKEVRRVRASRRARLRGLVGILAVLGLLIPPALATPRRSDEVALGVAALWAACLLLAATRPRRPGRPRPGGPGLRRAAAACLGFAAIAGGLGLYWLSLSLPLSRPVQVAGGLTAVARPCVPVTSPENPGFLGRVLAVGADLSVVIDAGGETLALAGIDPSAYPAAAVAAARRWLKATVLGRLVTVRVVGGLGGLQGRYPEAFLYSGVGDAVEGTGASDAPSGSSVNAQVALVLGPLPSSPAADGAASEDAAVDGSATDGAGE
jgi:hypothetical protein